MTVTTLFVTLLWVCALINPGAIRISQSRYPTSKRIKSLWISGLNSILLKMKIFVLILAIVMTVIIYEPVTIMIDAAATTGSPSSTPPPLSTSPIFLLATAKINAGATTTVKPTIKS